MRFDVAVPAAALKEIRDLARRVEELGAAGLWVSENQKNCKKVARAIQE